MTIEFQCTECGRAMRAPDGAAGKQGKCPQCGTVMPIPAPEPETPRATLTPEGKIEFPCPSCAAPVRTPASAAGKRGKCPHCGDIMQIPTIDEEPSDPAPAPSPAPRPQARTPSSATSKPKATGSPAAGATIQFVCSNCQNKMRAPTSMAGKNGKCPNCQTVVRIPGKPQGAASGGGLTALPSSGPSDPLGGLTPLSPSAGLTPLPASDGLSPLDDLSGLSPLGDLGGLAAFPADSGGSPFGAGAVANPFGVPATNPYAAPAYSPAMGSGGGSGGGLDFGRAFSRTWEVFTPNIGQAVLLTLTAGGISAVFGIGFQVLAWVVGLIGVIELAIAFLVVSAVAMALLFAYVMVGLQYSCLRWARTGKLNVGDFFGAGQHFLPVLAVNFLVGLATGGLTVVGYLPGLLLALADAGLAAALVTIAGVLVGSAAAVVVGLKFAMAPYYIMDKRRSAIDAMGASYRAMTLANCAIFFLTLLCASIAASLVMALTCYIGSLVAYPYLMLMVAVMYVQLADQGR